MENILDDFDKKLKERLTDLKVEPEADMWSRIEQSLDQNSDISTPRRTLFSLRTIISTAVAAIFIIGFFLLSNQLSKEEIALATITEERTDNLVNDEESIINIIEDIKKSNPSKVSAPVIKPDSTIEPARPNKVGLPEKKRGKDKQKQERQSQDKPRQLKQKERRISEGVNSSTNYLIAENRVESRAKRGNWSLSVNGSSNIISNSSTGDLAPISVSQHSPNCRKISAFSISPQYKSANRNWNHNLPISFSFNMRRMINSRIGFESGLTYTYLSSYSKGADKKIADLENRISYIGIPLDLVYLINRGDKFGFYAKAGVLIDKAVCAKSYSAFRGVKTSTELSKEGVQFSYNFNVGGEYFIAKNLSVYLEPTLSIYGNNNQPVSYRTANNYGLSASGGIRIKL